MDSQSPAPIIVGVDGSPSSIDALREAAALGRADGIPIEAVTAWQLPLAFDEGVLANTWSPEGEAAAILNTAAEIAFPAGQPERFTKTVVEGSPAQELIRRSAGARMLVVGSRGRGGFAGMLLGSVSAACAQHAQCPVLIMRHGSAHPSTDAETAPLTAARAGS